MDDLSIKLNDIKVGCTIGTTLINHLMYADDLVLLSPSAMGLSLLRSVCSAYGIEQDIKYNSAKSNVMIFRCNKMKDIRIPNFELNNVLLTRVTKYKYLGHCSHMSVSRGLPTCKMLIRKSIYGFMISTKRSCNTILQNIVGSDRIYTSPLLQHWRLLLYAHAF